MQWVTVNGRHIPVDEENKKRQIDLNKKQAEERNDSGKKASLSKMDKLNNRKTKEKKK